MHNQTSTKATLAVLVTLCLFLSSCVPDCDAIDIETMKQRITAASSSSTTSTTSKNTKEEATKLGTQRVMMELALKATTHSQSATQALTESSSQVQTGVKYSWMGAPREWTKDQTLMSWAKPSGPSAWLYLQINCDLVYNRNIPGAGMTFMWSTGINRWGTGCKAVFEANGNLAVVENGVTLWSAGTANYCLRKFTEFWGAGAAAGIYTGRVDLTSGDDFTLLFNFDCYQPRGTYTQVYHCHKYFYPGNFKWNGQSDWCDSGSSAFS
jgi:hypothetical protein